MPFVQLCREGNSSEAARPRLVWINGCSWAAAPGIALAGSRSLPALDAAPDAAILEARAKDEVSARNWRESSGGRERNPLTVLPLEHDFVLTPHAD
jgi:hypothetical protein